MFQIRHWEQQELNCKEIKNSIITINHQLIKLEKALGTTIPTKKQIDNQFNLMFNSLKLINIQKDEDSFSDKFKKVILKHKSDIKSPRSDLLNKMIQFVANHSNESRLGNHFCQDIGWSLVSENSLQFIENICRGNKVISIGSGKAYIESLLQNITITCFDISINELSFMKVQDITKEEPTWKLYDVLFLCWPHYIDRIASESLLNFIGNHLIYIGEERGGCTGDPEFFDLLSTNWNLENYIDLPNWSGIYSVLYYYTRRV